MSYFVLGESEPPAEVSVPMEGASKEGESLEKKETSDSIINEPPVQGAGGGEPELPTKDPDLSSGPPEHPGILKHEPGDGGDGEGGEPLQISQEIPKKAKG